MKIDFTEHLGKALGAMLAAGIVAVPVMQFQISALDKTALRLRDRVDVIDADLNLASQGVAVLAEKVVAKHTHSDHAPLGGGYDRKSALEDALQKLQAPPPIESGDDDDSGKPGDDDDSGS